MSRRTAKDLRVLCGSYVWPERRVPDDVDAPHGMVRLNYLTPVTETWEDCHARARRLESHGWIQWYELDAGEGTNAALTEVGRALLDTWRDREVDVDALLDTSEGGGVPEFIQFAKDRHLETDTAPDGGRPEHTGADVECEGCGVRMTDGHLCDACERAGVSIHP